MSVPNAEKLLGITVEQIREGYLCSGKTLSERDRRYKEELSGGDPGSVNRKNGILNLLHQKTGEHRWFHIVAMGSVVNGKKKYILVMSDRTV